MEDEVRRVQAKLKKHGYPLNPCLPETSIEEFEKLHAIQLPDDYRFFLAIAGDGGSGPHWGISRLSDWSEWFEDKACDPKFLSSPCPMVYEQAILPTWAESLPNEWKDWGYGSIHICSLGCGCSARLIVSGPSRGRVVYLDANGTDSRPYFVKEACFIAWYEHWLDLFASGAKLSSFGADNPDYPEA